MRNFLLIFATGSLLLLTSVSGCQNAGTSDQAALFSKEKEGLFSVTQEEARQLVEQRADVVLLDVRTAQEYADGHLQKAIHLDYLKADFPDQVKKLDPQKPYLVYCAVGGRSSKAATIMSKTGFREVYNASAGYKDLKDAGLPVE